MKNLLIILFIFTATLCKADYWTRKADFPGGPREGAYGFAIGNKAYVGGGSSGLNAHAFNDMWEYDPSANTWTQKASMPGIGRVFAGSFSIGNKGYICSGGDSSLHPLDSLFWQYDNVTDTWIEKANLPGAPRLFPFSFVIGNKAYVGGGEWSGFRDFYVFDPAANTWSTLDSLPFLVTRASAFSLNDSGYITGFLGSIPTPTVLEYIASTNTWVTKSNFPGPPRTDATAFSIGSNGYFGTGDDGGKLNDLWKYFPITDTWKQKTSIPCSYGKDEDPSFVINSKAYICFGADDYFNAELWEYTPDSLEDIKNLDAKLLLTKISPNPFSITTTITFNKDLQNAELLLTDITGRTIESYKNINGTELLLHKNSLAAGIYFYTILENGLILAKDKILVQ